jgi:digalactosyldiacylglycerol synthase
MSVEERRRLTWEAATERFLDVTGAVPGRAGLRGGNKAASKARNNTLAMPCLHVWVPSKLCCPPPSPPAELTAKDLKRSPVDNLLAGAHNVLTGLEPMRALGGAGANTRDNPQRITDYQPSENEVVGLFDDRRRIAVRAHTGAPVLTPPITAAAAAGTAAAAVAAQPAMRTIKQRA